MKLLRFLSIAAASLILAAFAPSQSFALAPVAPIWLQQTAIGYDTVNNIYSVTIQWRHGISDNGQPRAESFSIYRSLVGLTDSDKEFEFVGTVSGDAVAAETITYKDAKVSKGVYFYFVRGAASGEEGERSERAMIVAPGSYCVNLSNPELQFTTFPPMVASPGSAYTYTAFAQHRSLRVQGFVRYELVEGPAGLTIDEKSGVVQWQTPTDVNGNIYVKIRSYSLDSKTAEAFQEWYIRFATALELKSGATTSAGNEEAVTSALIQPNPANDMLTLSCTALRSGTAQISLVNTMGTVVMNGIYSMNEGNNRISFNVAECAAGRYTLSVVSANGVSSYPVVLIR